MTQSSEPLGVDYNGDAAALFPLALGTGLLSVVTLGVYRFWAKARIRRFIWSRIRVGDDTLEFTGTGIEMFLGFLSALVVLALYLAVVQPLLVSFGIRVIFAPETDAERLMQFASLALSFFASVPLLLYALYRARRYRLARTRLRGIRFGMDSAGAGYMWRSIVYGVLAVGSLGLLLPLMTFRLEKYMTDRCYWGTARLVQGGRWTALYRALAPYLIALVLTVAGTLLMIEGMDGFGVLCIVLGGGLMSVAWPIYRVRSFAYLTQTKEMDGGGRFDAQPHAGRVIWLYIKGSFIVGLLSGIASSVLFGLAAMLSIRLGAASGAEISTLTALEIAALGAMVYLIFLSVLGTLSLMFISQPVLGYLVGTVRLYLPDGFFDGIRQREADIGADADGFADALDVGGAF